MVSFGFAGSATMDVLKMLADLRQERESIEEAIVTLERLARGQGKRRGRPPSWMSVLKDKKPTKTAGRRGRPPKASRESEA
jgi:hypothetical protein